jgi:hypothetical protein
MKKHCAITTLRLAYAATALVCWSTRSAAGPVEDNVIGAFESYCLDKLSRSRLLSTEKVGSETQSIFAVTHPDPRGAADGHAKVMAASSELPSVAGAGLTSIPEKAAKAGGINVPQVWP